MPAAAGTGCSRRSWCIPPSFPDTPEIVASDCPSNRTWLQGTWEVLSCHAAGNPTPTVICSRNGITVSTGQPELVTRSRAGTYLCNATNSLGMRSRLVTVRVECEWCRHLLLRLCRQQPR